VTAQKMETVAGVLGVCGARPHTLPGTPLTHPLPHNIQIYTRVLHNLQTPYKPRQRQKQPIPTAPCSPTVQESRQRAAEPHKHSLRQRIPTETSAHSYTKSINTRLLPTKLTSSWVQRASRAVRGEEMQAVETAAVVAAISSQPVDWPNRFRGQQPIWTPV